MTDLLKPPPVDTAQPDKPMAEGRWLWRRLYVFGLSLALWSLLVRAVRTTPPEAMPRITEGLMSLLGLLLVLYLVAPTAQQLIELSASLKMRPGGRL